MSYRLEKTQEGQDIVISGFEKGISNNPYTGIADMRNIDPSTIPGEVSVAMSTQVVNTQGPITNAVFTVDPTTDIFTYNGTIPLENYTAITVSNSGGALPGGLSANKAYTIANKTPTTFQLVNSSVPIYTLVVAGGGGSGDGSFNGLPGAGGAGGFSYSTSNTISVGSYPVVVGAGGLASTGSRGGTGGSSIFLSTVMLGGTGGGDSNGTTAGVNSTGGGSAGGGGTSDVGGTATGGGYNGGNGTGAAGGGGGGSSAAGSGATGGIGTSNSITGSPVTYATGGSWSGTGAVGGANTGNGASAGTHQADPAKAGGSGVVIISYVTGSMTATGGTITTSGGRTIHTFTSSGTFVVSAISYLDITSAGTGTQTFSTINMGIPKFFADTLVSQNTERTYFMLDDYGRAWVLYNGAFAGATNKWVYMNNLALENQRGYGNGLAAWKNNLFVFDPTTISVMRLNWIYLTSLAQITNYNNWIRSWQTTLTSTYNTVSHYALVGQDDVVYFCSGSNVGSIGEVPGTIFHPTTGRTVSDGVTTINSPFISSATMAFTGADMGSPITGTNIPTGSYIIQIVDSTTAVIGDVSGTVVNATGSGTGITFTIPTSYSYNSSALDIPSYDQAICLAELGTTLLIGGINNLIYPWDRISPSFNYPIFLSENYVSRMVTVNTTCYIFCGYRGRIYITNGSNVLLYAEISDNLSKVTSPYYIWKDACFNRNQLYFGFSVTDNSGNTINEYGGLWTIDLTTKGLRMSNQLSYGTYSGYVSALGIFSGDTIGAIPSADGYGLFIGWYSGSTSNIDKTISTPYSSGQAYIITDIISVATKIYNKTFKQVEWKLTTPMGVGDIVSIYQRKYNNTAFAPVGTTSYSASHPNQVSDIYTANIINAEWVQFKIILSSATYTSGTGIHFKELRLR